MAVGIGVQKIQVFSVALLPAISGSALFPLRLKVKIYPETAQITLVKNRL